MNCDIIIPVWDQLEATRQCMDSIVKHTSCPYRLIIIDNGSREKTSRYLEEFKSSSGAAVTLIRNQTNLGFVKAANQGIRASGAPYVCLMNNDTVATDGWLTEIIKAMDSNPKLGLANPSSNTSGQFPGKGQTIEDYAAGLKNLKGQLQELCRCRGFCMVMKRSVVERLGVLYEIYNIGYFEETDYSLRALEAGFGIARVKSSYVYHREGATFKTLKDTGALFKANEEIFLKRWGKRLRIAYLVKTGDDYDRVDREVTELARNGHEIMVFLKKGLKWPVSIDHFGIRRIDINPCFFDIIAAYKIFRYRRKKKIDMVKTNF